MPNAFSIRSASFSLLLPAIVDWLPGLCLGAQGFARACQARKAHTDFGNLGARERQVNPSRNNSSKGLINIGSQDRSPVIECTGSMRLSVQFVFAELTASCHLIDEGA